MTLLSAHQLIIAAHRHSLCDAFDFTMQGGEIVGVIGPNGCGKTTLLHTLAGLLPPKHGDIFLAGLPLSTYSEKALAAKRSLLFQDSPSLFLQTVWEYCLTSRFPHMAYFQGESAQDKQLVHAALQTMALETLHNRTLTKLSGGERRRVEIAAVLAQTPQLYLLDEPTNHLDLRHQMMVLRHFQHLAKTQKAGVIIALHDLHLVQRFCTRVIMIFSDGKILQGNTEALLTSHNLSALFDCEIQVEKRQETLAIFPVD